MSKKFFQCWKFWPLLLVLSLAGFVSAQALVAQPVEPLFAAPLVLELSPNSATISVSTITDVACVVVYGSDENFGQMAFDQGMGTEAHQDHLVILRGLMPDSNYVFRFQGSAPDGTFYASEIMSFRTPAATASPDLGLNLATLARGARVAAVSSNYGGGDNNSRFGANNAIDENPDSEWSSAGEGNAASITIALPESAEISGFGLWTRTMGSSAQISQFVVENELGEVFGPFDLPDASGIYRFPVNARGQEFTFRITESSGGNTGLVELAIYAQP